VWIRLSVHLLVNIGVQIISSVVFFFSILLGMYPEVELLHCTTW
jgi:hypothetical protein